jgi:hypothetical protein
MPPPPTLTVPRRTSALTHRALEALARTVELLSQSEGDTVRAPARAAPPSCEGRPPEALLRRSSAGGEGGDGDAGASPSGAAGRCRITAAAAAAAAPVRRSGGGVKPAAPP